MDKEAQPAAIPGLLILMNIITITTMKLIKVIKNPTKVASLNGTIEKLVKTLNHKEMSLKIAQRVTEKSVVRLVKIAAGSAI